MSSRYDRSGAVQAAPRPFSGTGEAPRHDISYQGLSISKPASTGPKTFQMKEMTERATLTCVDWTCEGDSIVSGSAEGVIKRHDATALKVDWSCTLASATSHVDCLAANPQTRTHVAAAVSDPTQPSSGMVAHFDMRSGRHSGKAESSDSIGNPALSIAWHPNGTRLGVSRKNGKVSIYDIRKLGSKPRALCEKNVSWELNKFLFFGSGDQIVASYGHRSKGGFKVLEAANLSEVRSVECHIMPCVGLAQSSSGQLLATGGNDAVVTVWNMEHCNVVQTLHQPEWHCDHVGISHDGSMLAYSGAHADGRQVSLEIAEQFSDAAVQPVIHTLTDETVSSQSALKGCSVSDLSWNPKHLVLAFCGRSADRSHIALVTKAEGGGVAGSAYIVV